MPGDALNTLWMIREIVKKHLLPAGAHTTDKLREYRALVDELLPVLNLERPKVRPPGKRYY